MKKTYKIAPSLLLILALVIGDTAPLFAATGKAETAAKTIDISIDEDEAAEDEKADDGESPEEKKIDIDIENAGEDGASEKTENYAIVRPDPSEMTEVRIGNYEEWCDLAHKCTLDSWSADKYVVLTDNIDCNMQKFEPIPYFAGIFEGNDHTINKAAFTEDQNYIGVFSKTAPEAVIRNVNVIGVMKPGGKPFDIGGIVGDNAGMIANCKYDGYVEGYDYIGGIAGYNEATGIISACTSKGKITGLHYVGGVCGANAGLVTGCSANADINTVTKEMETGLADIKVEEVFTSLLNKGREEGNKKSIANSSNPVDIGGIVGHNTGEISSCANDSTVGYEHVGYNVGGIVGRSSGYVHDCINNGELNGRKDVGGIVGQAEPYIRLDLTKDIITQLNAAINSMHDSVDKTIKDTDASSGVVSARLNVIKNFADRALSDTGYLANSTTDFVNGVTGATNEMVGRLEYVMKESSKSDGPLEDVSKAGDDLKNAAGDVERVAEDLNIYNYMGESDKADYDNAKKAIKDAQTEYDGYYKAYMDSDEARTYRDGRKAWYIHDKGWDDPSHVMTPEEEAEADAYAEAQVRIEANNRAKTTYDSQTGRHAGSYETTMTDNAEKIAGIVLKYAGSMEENAAKDGRNAAGDLRKMAENLRDAGSSMRSIVGNVAGKSAVRLPQLSDEYRMRTNSLVSNIQGMSDNLGFLNNEMKGSTDVVCNDLEDVNDQFASIMLLFTDAMDGVLDMDYSDVYEDESNDVCATSVDATIANCSNFGKVFGDIDTGGIAGTMAEEYDFDLESDVTGIKDAAANSTYRTKCVARENSNRGEVKGKKSYAGGVCGLHEIGTILECSNFSKVSSDSGDYVGGVAGRSYATIRDSYAKGVLAGDSYIGGIAGTGASISGCLAMPNIIRGTNFTGAVVGSAGEDDKLKGNFFVSDTLAGIDRVSESGRAEPVTYSQLLAIDGIPADFSIMHVDFVVDGKNVASIEKKAGDVLTSDQTPAVSDKVTLEDDQYIEWDCENEVSVCEDTEIKGEIVRYASCLACEQVRANKQSIFLVDGRFVKGDELKVEAAASPATSGTEEFLLTIPDDGEVSHRIRYQMPADVKGVTVQMNLGADWEDVPTDTYGKYITFNAPGNRVRVRVLEQEVRDFTKWYIIGGSAAAVIIIAVIILMIVKKNRKKKDRIKPAKAAE